MGTLALARDEEADTERTGRPVFSAGPAVGKRTGTEHSAAFARRRVRQTRHYGSFRMRSTEPIAIDGLAGFEVLATATSDSDVPTTIYTVVLFEGASYWILQGVVRTADAEPWVPRFERMAASARRGARARSGRQEAEALEGQAQEQRARRQDRQEDAEDVEGHLPAVGLGLDAEDGDDDEVAEAVHGARRRRDVPARVRLYKARRERRAGPVRRRRRTRFVRL
jgi:hypothetical protein